MSLEKLKGAAEAVGCELVYNRSLGFYEVVKGARRIKYISADTLKAMDVPTFVSGYLKNKHALTYK